MSLFVACETQWCLQRLLGSISRMRRAFSPKTSIP
jgi:hypothetical protein